MSSSQLMSSPGRESVEIEVLDEGHLLLVREAMPGEELGVERLDLLGLGVGELVRVRLALRCHDSTVRRSAICAV